MESYNYQNETVIDYLPNKVDLNEQLAISSDIKSRRYVEIYPPNQNLTGINSSSMNNVSVFKISSPSEWMDCMNANLVATVNNVTLPASTKVNGVLLDGKFALINRVNCTVGGIEVCPSNSQFSTHRNAKYLNEAFVDNYLNDATLLNAGNAKLASVLKNSTLPTGKSLYGDLISSPFNMIDSTKAAAATNSTAVSIDAYGVLTVANTTQMPAGFGYQNKSIQNTATQTVTIPLGDLVSLFSIDKYFPLFAVGEVVLTISWNSPVIAFWSDCCTVSATSTFTGVAPIASYGISDIKLACDLLTCSDALNNSYKEKALSEEGINIVFDDWIVGTSNPINFTGNGARQQMKVDLSTSSLKSILFYFQGQNENAQNAWSNSHFPYLGIQNFQCMVNNINYPPNPLSNCTDIVLYNNRGRGVINNQLSQFVANNPYVLGRSECAVTGNPSTGVASTADDPSTCVTAFMIYNNFERILNENPQLLKNGVDLKSGTSSVTITWNENNDNANQAPIVKGALGSANGQYNGYALCTYQRLFQIARGKVDIIG
jgi:hypothetical protein